jgi:hypothetical protein
MARALATPAEAGAAEGWYVFRQDTQQCEVTREGPAESMALSDKMGEQYTMEDVTEHGQIVQTTMSWRRGGEIWGIIFYRGLARCEQARRTKRESQEQRREKYR